MSGKIETVHTHTHTHTQIITVYPIEDDDDHYIAKLDDDSFGQIPKMYVELL